MPRLLEALRLFNSAASEGRSGWQPSLPLELALADAIQEKALPVMAQTPAHPLESQSGAVEEKKTPAPAVKPAQTQEKPIPPAPTVPPSGRSEGAGNPPPPPKGKGEVADATQISAPVAPAQEAPSDDSAILQRIAQNWPRVRVAVKKMRPSTEALLNSCKLLGMKNGALLLGFQGEIVKSKMEIPENLELTRQAITSVTGVSVAVVCVVSNKSGAAPADLDVDRDGMVGTALNLGGQIVHKE